MSCRLRPRHDRFKKSLGGHHHGASEGVVAVFPDADPFNLADPQPNLAFGHAAAHADLTKGKQADRER